ncbi:MAG TPA: HhH-GPD-type base excision DNA repair protein [Acidimicrobiales bacterium]|nr:HhH-GPD-type base excision DNA repair protein [Acidimicrobiales bacterium]
MIQLSGNPAADKLLTDDPLALVIGMVLDQQIPLEKAFTSPYELKERLGGSLDVGKIASMDPEALADIFSERPALHRFPRSMASRVQEVSRLITENYGGDASAIWNSAADGKELLANVRALPGFGAQKARIFIALLGKQRGLATPGWQQVSTPYSQPGTFQSVADIDSPASLAKVRQFKQEKKAQAKAQASTTN